MGVSCSKCGAQMACGASSGASSCWCQELPPIELSGEDCLCRTCLSQAVESSLREKAGLCAGCRHAKRLSSKSKSILFQCGRAASDRSFAKFPRLPVVSCAGFEKSA